MEGGLSDDVTQQRQPHVGASLWQRLHGYVTSLRLREHRSACLQPDSTGGDSKLKPSVMRDAEQFISFSLNESRVKMK